MTASARPEGSNGRADCAVARCVMAARCEPGGVWHLVDYSRLVDDMWHPTRCGKDYPAPIGWQPAASVAAGGRCVRCSAWPAVAAW